MASVAGMMMKARKLSREDNAQAGARFKEILSIVKKHDVVHGLTPEKTVALLQDLGTTFVKLGQIASTHPDVLPPEYCEALGALRTQASPMSFETVKQQVESELGKPLDELFESFDEQAVGSASVAQVHRATLPDGALVAVKVQRPGIVETVTNDLAIMERLVEIYELVERGEGGLSVKELVNEMVKTSTEELDFGNEAANLDRFYANNEPRENVASPKCYRDYTTAAVLTEDFVDAPCVEDVESLGLGDDEREALAYLVASNYMQQMMEDGFYHADPHAGNVLLPTAGGIEWIDFGMMGTMTSSQRDTLEELILALVKGDAYNLKRSVLKVATPTGPIDHAALLEMCERMTDQFIGVDLESFDTAALMNEMTKALRDSGFDVDPFLVSLGRGLVTLEGTIHLISPKLNIMEVLSEHLRNSFDPSRIEKKLRRMASQGIDSAEAMTTLPSKTVETLDMVQKGQVRIGMELSGSEKFSRDVRAAGGLVAVALVAMGLIIGSCVIDTSSSALQIAGVSAIGTFGLAAGIALAIYIVVKIHPYLK